MTLWCSEKVWLGAGEWSNGPIWIETDKSGVIKQVKQKKINGAVRHLEGYLIPGMFNAHSHVFQYAMAGEAEYLPKAASGDDFWSWREAMYQLALAIEPQDLAAIARLAYVEMLRLGYTHVVEFHYLQHDPKGKSYKQRHHLAEILLKVAAEVGIGMTMVPVYYQWGGFNKPASERQRRFLAGDVESFYEAWQSLAKKMGSSANSHLQRLGIGIHSVRAASGDDIAQLGKRVDSQVVFHAHAAEQKQEVDDCLAATGMRPVEYLLRHIPNPSRLALTHATHMTPEETSALARSKATAIVCPSTEGNLGDGFFPLTSYLAQTGSLAIGSDSHIGLSPFEDLRWLDYGQRLLAQKRNVICQHPGDHSADQLYAAALTGGRRAAGYFDWNSIWQVGKPFHGLVINPDHPCLAGKQDAHLLGALQYAADSTAITGTIVGNQQVVKKQKHPAGGATLKAYVKAKRLLNNRLHP